MKKILLLIIPIVLFGCATSDHTISRTADMSNYQYAAIGDVMNYGGSAELFDMDVKIFDLLNEAGIDMIGEKELLDLSKADKQNALLVKYTMEEVGYNVSVSITFVDYITERPVASCRGGATNWWGSGVTRKKAVDNALEEAKEIFGLGPIAIAN